MNIFGSLFAAMSDPRGFGNAVLLLSIMIAITLAVKGEWRGALLFVVIFFVTFLIKAL